jgi:hypothetical protein
MLTEQELRWMIRPTAWVFTCRGRFRHESEFGIDSDHAFYPNQYHGDSCAAESRVPTAWERRIYEQGFEFISGCVA